MEGLPNELIEQILLYLNHKEIALCYKSSAKFHVLAETTLVKMLEEHIPRWEAGRDDYRPYFNYYVEMWIAQDILTIFLDYISYEKTTCLFQPWMLHGKLNHILNYCDDKFSLFRSSFSYAEYKNILKRYCKDTYENCPYSDPNSMVPCASCNRRVYGPEIPTSVCDNTDSVCFFGSNSIFAGEHLMYCDVCDDHTVCENCITYCCDKECMRFCGTNQDCLMEGGFPLVALEAES